MPWRRALMVSSPSATEEIGAMGREMESCQGIYLYVWSKLKNPAKQCPRFLRFRQARIPARVNLATRVKS
jgi:hypothetical protein